MDEASYSEPIAEMKPDMDDSTSGNVAGPCWDGLKSPPRSPYATVLC